jgi:hypothetical protein
MAYLPKRIKQSSAIPESAWEKNLQQSLNEYTALLGDILNGGIRLDEHANLANKTATTPATPGEEFTVAHGLKRVPIGWFVISKDKACDIYLGSTSATAENLYLKCSVASASVRLLVI